MVTPGLGGYCGTEFWNLNVTWYTDNPDFTRCFQKTVLVWVPCGILWLLAPLETHLILKSTSRFIPWTILNIAKCIISLLLICTQIADLIFTFTQSSAGETVYSADYYTPVIIGVTLLLALIFILLGRRRGIRSSGVLCIFWFFMTLCGVVSYRTHIMNITDDSVAEDILPFATYMVYYPLILGQFLLSCFADAAPQYIEDDTKDENPNPEKSSSFLSRMSFTWFDSMAWRGWRRPLERKDLWDLNTEDRCRTVVPNFQKHWLKSLDKSIVRATDGKADYSKTLDGAKVEFSKPRSKLKRASILPSLWKTFGSPFLFGAFLKLVYDCLNFVNPQILSLIITYVQSGDDEPEWKGFFYAALMIFTSIVMSFLLNQYFMTMFLVGMRVRTSLISAVYTKALKVSNVARKESTVGEIVNLMAVDAQRFMDLTSYINLLWSAPLQIALALYFLWQELGPSVLAGLAVMIILVPVNGVIANMSKKLQLKQMKYKDQRVKLMNEILSGIKVLKLYAWEPSFQDQVLGIRNKEIHVLKQAAYLNAGTSFIWTCAPFIVSLVSFIAYLWSDPAHVLDAQRAFVALALFNMLRFPMSMLPMIIITCVQASVSLTRMNKFLNAEELDPNSVQHDQFENDPLSVENGSFSWDPEESITLRNINLRVSEGSLVAVVGTVGSGKSSLLSALLGEMEKLTGRVNTKGSIAYAAQQAWIQNATVQDNILFGRTHDRQLYDKVVHACALKSDLDILPAGDRTEIGEKGINLSGGQKQRVSLARAVYNNADIYLLDDPLSAVDSHVGKHIFEKVIGPEGLLRNKTRILVTHGITYLSQTDMIVVLKNGEISEQGTFKELLAHKGDFADFLMQYLTETNEELDEDIEELDEVKQKLEAAVGKEEFQRQMSRVSHRTTSESESDGQAGGRAASRAMSVESSPEKEGIRKRRGSKSSKSGSVMSLDKPKKEVAGEKLIEAEKSETGKVKFDVYIHYIKAIGLTLSFLTFLLYAVAQGCSVGASMWLSVWTSDVSAANDTAKRDMYLGVYGALGVGQAIFVLVFAVVVAFGTLNASGILHLSLLSNVFKSPTSFFDTTPIGRIVNRFAKDIDVVDQTLPMNLKSWITCLYSVLGTFVAISYSTPIFITVVIPMGIIYYFMQAVYVSTSRQLKRLESVSRSPIYSHFSETITGAATIRAYGKAWDFELLSENKVDNNQACYYPSMVANRWLAFRLDLIGTLIVFFAALFAVLGRSTLDPGLVGLSISYAMSVTQTLNWLVRMTSDVETNIVAVERIKEYTETEQEAAWNVPENKPHMDWPTEGKVKFDNYQTRYRKGLDLVLKGISCDVDGGEKVGIVGRTGAGKSSLTLALFRIIEAAGGAIIMDGVDISKIGLHDLRSRITIIPQDPVLFSGTLRINLDPFSEKKDEDIWRALEHAHLKSFVKGLTAGLQYEVTEGGDNLSVGQRQLICLARALLRKTKILILDEATAAVDLETDDLIQATIRQEFRDCTVLTIAHRLNTIMDSSRVMVLDQGNISELDTPANLLNNKKSIFYGMAKDAGLV